MKEEAMEREWWSWWQSWLFCFRMRLFIIAMFFLLTSSVKY